MVHVCIVERDVLIDERRGETGKLIPFRFSLLVGEKRIVTYKNQRFIRCNYNLGVFFFVFKLKPPHLPIGA